MITGSSTVAIADLTAGWQCKKRNGDMVAFDCSKISKALWRCFNAVSLTESYVGQHEKTIASLLMGVVNSLTGEKNTTPDVEHVQRLVIQQLWSRGLFPAAEHYQNYREAHRLARLQHPIEPEVAARVTADQKHFPTDLQYYQFMSKFSRWNDTYKRRETWYETTYERVIPWLQRVPQAAGKLTDQEWKELSDAMYNMEVSPAMRVVQMAGPALDRCNVGVYNCAYSPLSDIFSFPEMLYVLMQGTGHGFSCEMDYVSQLPRVKKQRKIKPDTRKVEDHTEGWCDFYYEMLQRLWDGSDLIPDVSGVRKKGSVLKVKGGRASGPEPYVDLLCFARNLIKSRQGRFLTDLNAHDLACKTGQIVQVGGVRRAAEISLSDLTSEAMRHAKSGDWYPNNRHRSMANNSAVYDFDEEVPFELFLDEWTSLIKSKSGERGIFNRRAAYKYSPTRRDWTGHVPGCNPCAEILLRPWEFCNLSIVVAREWDTVDSIKRKVRLAAIFGKIQSLCTDFKYIRPEWKKNCEEERLLGVDITGHADCPFLRYGAPGRDALLRELNKIVDDVDIEFSKRFGVNRSAANTTVKPSGDSAVFFNCASGVSPRFASFSMRWVRESRNSPIAKFLRDSGVPCAPAPEAPDNLDVFGFPTFSPKGAMTRKEMSATQQFENWLEWKQNWAEHSVSATIYADDSEWLELGSLVYKNIDKITGLSFLPRDNGIYNYPPWEELSETDYNKAMETFPDLNWAKLSEYESEDMTEGAQTFACVGEKC